ncbi:MAG: DUF2095 family protein [Candidatus Lokiarchaeota archaeon]|nr:DUF2095 family protein [Candidatus Lokiarchaeota archaeon]
MEKEEKKDTEKKKNLDITDEDGLKIAYDTEEFENQFPQLMRELSEKKKSLKIESVDYEIEQTKDKPEISPDINYCEDLLNPGVIDFIRRCKKKEDAIEILDYLLKRNELDLQDYNALMKRIKEEGELEKLLAECGGLKTSGYYERKFPRKVNILNSDQSKNENLD